MGLSLKIDDLSWSFDPGALPFLRIPRLELEPGGVLAVTGPSGSGKSTLLFLLAGLEAASPGTLVWGGTDLGALTPAARDLWRRTNLGLVFQDFQLVPELTAADNVLLPLTFGRWSVPRRERHRAAELLIRLGVSRTQARASSLSRGEMQRTALARALFLRPPVLLADEPTASLDSGNEEAVFGHLLDAARSQGTTLVVATHQAGFRHRADRVVHLDHGSLTEVPA